MLSLLNCENRIIRLSQWDYFLARVVSRSPSWFRVGSWESCRVIRPAVSQWVLKMWLKWQNRCFESVTHHNNVIILVFLGRRSLMSRRMWSLQWRCPNMSRRLWEIVKTRITLQRQTRQTKKVNLALQELSLIDQQMKSYWALFLATSINLG